MADRIRFHQWVQLQIDRQLARASRAMPVMQDLPIGFDPDGADGWAFQDVLAQGISVGAPPDEFNTKGQNWGLPPFVPRRLRQAGYQPFIETIRACVRHSGGLRIDHVMGLFRLFWIPAGMEARQGAYVRSEAQDLLAIVALESRRARAVIVGEDLGTVEDDVRGQLLARRMLSYRLLWFEKRSPAKYPKQALAAVTTHDLPTIAGLWTGSDLQAQKDIGLSPNEQGTREILTRVRRLTGATPRTPLSTVVVRVHEAHGHGPVAHPHRDAGRRDARHRAAEHAGDDRGVAELVDRASGADRVAGEEPPRGADRARAGQARGPEEARARSQRRGRR